jgi:hypothetical protein
MGLLCFLFPVLILILGTLVSVIPAYFAVRNRRRAALIKDMRPRRLKKLQPGIAKVRARVIAQEDLLRSPLGRHPCVYYKFTVAEQRSTGGSGRHGGGGTYWHTVVDDTDSLDVVLEDETGQAEIDLREAEIVLESQEYQTSGVFNDPPERLKDLLRNRYGKSTKGLFFNKSMQFWETILSDGAEVVVVGEVELDRDGIPEFRRGDIPLILSDKGDRALASHYQRKAMWCWVGMGFVLFISLVLTGFSGCVAYQVGQGVGQHPPGAPLPGGQPQQPGQR